MLGFLPIADCVPMRKRRFFMSARMAGFTALIEPSFIGLALAHSALFQGL
jgi:hypothetical protein